jgi:hypothetical protein
MIRVERPHEGDGAVTVQQGRQPAVEDAYDFLGDEDQPVVVPRPAEFVALHTISDEPSMERLDSEPGDDDEPPATWFDDEEPEAGYAVEAEERTADLEDVLIVQHYVFADADEPDDLPYADELDDFDEYDFDELDALDATGRGDVETARAT